MSDLWERLIWVSRRRRQLASRLKNFWASPLSYADRQCQFSDYNRIYKGTQLRAVSVGVGTYIGENVRGGEASIGRYSSIGHGTIVGGMGSHPTDRLSTHPAFYSTTPKAGITFATEDGFEECKPTSVGSDVWLGARCVLLDGVSIGDGAIVAAGAIVTKDVPPYAVVAGVPARILRTRFGDEVVTELLRRAWWNLPAEQLQRIAKDIGSVCSWSPEAIRALLPSSLDTEESENEVSR